MLNRRSKLAARGHPAAHAALALLRQKMQHSPEAG